MMHVRNADTKSFRTAVDQCAEVGFEMIIYTFGSGLDVEREDPAYIAKVKADEAARKIATQKEKAAAREREQAKAKSEREVDDELAALKKKIRGQ